MKKQVKDFGVVAQVKLALNPRNRLATALGFVLGGFVPLAIYFVSHSEACSLGQLTFAKSGPWFLVFGGLAYSAQTVFQWAKMAFSSATKSFGFCILIEGIMVSSHTHWLSVAALCYLVCINGVATGCRLTVGSRS